MQEVCRSYCLHCATGREAGVASQIQRETGLTALAPTLVQMEWKGRTVSRREQTMFPGYVFLYDSGIATPELHGVHHVRRLLAYDAMEHRLYGRDADIAKWLLQYGGVIRESKALREGDHIVVVDGPMKDLGGTIKNVNKQRQRANIEFTFEGITRSVWMAFEWVASADDTGYRMPG